MIVSPKHKFVYMNIGKTGSISLGSLFEKQFDAFVWREWHETAKWPKCAPQHICHLPKQFSDYMVISSVRNPFTHEMSRHTHGNKKDVSMATFKKWLKRGWMETYSFKLNMNNECQIPFGCVKYSVDHFIRLESIEKDFMKLPFADKPIKIPHRNKTQNDQNTLFYTEELADLVRKFRDIDFKLFGYFTELPKEMRKITCL